MRSRQRPLSHAGGGAAQQDAAETHAAVEIQRRDLAERVARFQPVQFAATVRAHAAARPEAVRDKGALLKDRPALAGGAERRRRGHTKCQRGKGSGNDPTNHLPNLSSPGVLRDPQPGGFPAGQSTMSRAASRREANPLARRPWVADPDNVRFDTICNSPLLGVVRSAFPGDNIVNNTKQRVGNPVGGAAAAAGDQSSPSARTAFPRRPGPPGRLRSSAEAKGHDRSRRRVASVIYRYVLHLEDTEARRTIRWTFTHPIAESHVVDLPTFGRWYVTRVLTEDANGAGVAYCTPAE